MDTRKLVLRYLVVLQVYQGSHFVHSSQDPDAALIPDKVCLPYDKAELDSYLKELDTPEASISNTGSSLSVKDIESLPFGALSVDWRRLRLLSDLSTLPKPGIDKISSYNDFTGVSEEDFSTTGNIRVPDDKRETTTHVRLHRSTLNNRNGNIDYSTMTVEPDTFDGSREEIPSVTESEAETGVDIEENFWLTGIPMLEEVEKSNELITTVPNLTTTPLSLTTDFKNTDSGIEEIKPDSTITAITDMFLASSKSSPVDKENFEEESNDWKKFLTVSSTTEEAESTYYKTSDSDTSDTETTKRTVILRIGELFSSVPKFVEHHGDREVNKNHVSRVRNFVQNRQNMIDSGKEDALAKTRLSVFEPFELAKKLRNRKPKLRYGKDGLVKRGGHNTDTEKLYRWFYRSDRNPENSRNTEAEIKCIERS